MGGSLERFLGLICVAERFETTAKVFVSGGEVREKLEKSLRLGNRPVVLSRHPENRGKVGLRRRREWIELKGVLGCFDGTFGVAHRGQVIRMVVMSDRVVRVQLQAAPEPAFSRRPIELVKRSMPERHMRLGQRCVETQ